MTPSNLAELKKITRIDFSTGRGLDLTEPVVMGAINVTPDSFSDGGEAPTVEIAVERALAMIDDGAKIIDIGGESSRPGAQEVPVDEELKRATPVIAELRDISDVVISVDTRKSEVAQAAIDCGADIINDISAGLFDPKMIPLVSARRAGYLLMHMRGTPQTMQDEPQYKDVVAQVLSFLKKQTSVCLDVGIDPKHIMIDPGIGFGKRLKDNIALMENINQLGELGYPVVIGLSRKSFIRGLDPRAVSPGDRLGGSIASALAAFARGAKIIRVHDVRETVQALRVYKGIMNASRQEENIKDVVRASA
ncbi:MAG: dihydropteroate synthase [candidate division Zixibacteria bacterium]|nr:dihydropteroate synthase [candidate division Zixibacteria bacterium]